jgi:hypothetical protein
MDTEFVAVVARHLERLLVVGAGAGSLYLGFRMFLAIPRAHVAEGGEAKLGLPGGISLYVTRLGPGVFFGLFGAAVLVTSLTQGITTATERSGAREASPPRSEETSGSHTVTVIERSSYSGAGALGDTSDRGEVERTQVLDEVRMLSHLAQRVDTNRCAVDDTEKVDFSAALESARKRLLSAVWHEPSWGPHAAFVRWFDEGMPTEAVAPPFAAFRGQR